MQTTDRGAFDDCMRKLCAGFDKPPSPDTSEAFWDGCKRLTIRQFRAGVNAALETLDGKFPRPKQIAKLAYEGASEHAQVDQNRAQAERLAQDAKYPKWLSGVNLLFTQWMWREIHAKKRVIRNDRSIPEPELAARRAACRQLAHEFEQMEREGSENATREAMRAAFSAHMRHIAASNPA